MYFKPASVCKTPVGNVLMVFTMVTYKNDVIEKETECDLRIKFRAWKLLYCNLNSPQFLSKGSITNDPPLILMVFGAEPATIHYWKQSWSSYWRMYASPGLDELKIIFTITPPLQKFAKLCYHIEAETRWSTFSRRYFQMHLLEWKCMNFDYDFTEVCS